MRRGDIAMFKRNAEIVRLYDEEGLSQHAIGRRIGLSANQIGIILRECWQEARMEMQDRIDRADQRRELLWRANLKRALAGESTAIANGIKLLEREARMHGMDKATDGETSPLQNIFNTLFAPNLSPQPAEVLEIEDKDTLVRESVEYGRRI